ncbi:RNA-directed DNA polymerase from transposon X-element, partial [Paramuricea clavata]
MNQARQNFYRQFISENSQDQRKLFRATKGLFRHDSDLAFPHYNDSNALSNDLGQFFAQKIINIRSELQTASTYEQAVFSDMPSVSLNSDQIYQEFSPMSDDDTERLITSSNKKSCSLDPIPTKLVVECLNVLLPVITKMINLSLESGIFPCVWKEADVQPRLKKQGLEVIFENLRPISNLPYVSKLVERTVYNQSHNHLSVHHLYPGNQSAYREFHSTETALLRVKNDILMNMNRQHVTLLVLLDLSAAFDTVDHVLLLQRLQLKFGLSGTVLKWFTSYLSQRTQRVTVGGVSSEKFKVDCGVPQGSCLGPLLFVLYVSELLELIERHLPDAHAYADDTQLYISFRADSRIDQETAVRTVDMCIDDIKRWMLANRLKLNEGKTESQQWSQLGKTLDVLEEWITDIFTLIPRRNSQDSAFYDINSVRGFTPDKFHKLYKVVPVNDIHEVEITWVLPPLQKYYRTKPLNYISWLLGHESRGSVLAWLKEKGWATALCAGNSGSGQEFNTIYSFFTCEVYLTVSGLEHYIEVIAVIFQYLEMLRRIGPNSRVFNEIKSIGDNNFRFKEEVDPSDYVEEIAECMQLYPEKDYLTGSDLIWDFDEKIITDVQNNLTPDKANIMLISKTLSSECTEKEKWFDTQYCVQDLNRDLYLPEKNIFI